MGIHFNHKSKAGDRKMQKELKLKMKAEERKKNVKSKKSLKWKRKCVNSKNLQDLIKKKISNSRNINY